MSDQPTRYVNRWLWRASLATTALTLVAAAALVVALALGWNDPRPHRPPDWEAPNLPLLLTAPPRGATVTLLQWSGGDFALEGEIAPRSGPEANGYGLAFGARDTDNYTVFAVGSDGYYAVLQVAGQAVVPLVDWQQFPHIYRGQQANHLRLACAESTCRFYINDEYAVSLEDASWGRGQVGLWVCSLRDEEVTAEFLSVRAWAETR